MTQKVRLLAVAVWCSASFATAEQYNPAPIDSKGIRGSLIIAGGGSLPDEVRQAFFQLAGGKDARLVVIPTAGRSDDAEAHEKIAKPWNDLGPKSLAILHTRDPKQADDDEFIAPLRDATGVWFSGGLQSRIAKAYLGTKVERELHALLERDGVIGGTSAGAAIQSRTMIAGGNPVPRIEKGFDLLPGAIIDQHFHARNRQPRLEKAIADHPNRFGLGIDESTAVAVRGRSLVVLGKADATVVLAASDERPSRVYRIKPGEHADLVALQRAAKTRSDRPAFLSRPGRPLVESGSLVLIGGGGMPKTIVDRMIELAGGPDAPIVVLPTATTEIQARLAGVPDFFEKAGCTDVTILPQMKKEQVESPECLDAIGRAKMIWFGGGRQWRFVDAYEGTKAIEAFRGVLRRGGVIAGSSAGATIQGEYLCRGNPLGNRDIMSEGYEQGFAFLPGVGIDQHFAQRNRFDDMASMVRTFPQFLGIGIDESTALIVQKSVGEVIGKGEVHFYDRRSHEPAAELDSVDENITPLSVSAGKQIDLLTGKAIGR